MDRVSAWYLPGAGSRVESHVFSNDPVADKSETPVAFGKVEKGWLGYTGNVNKEDETPYGGGVWHAKAFMIHTFTLSSLTRSTYRSAAAVTPWKGA